MMCRSLVILAVLLVDISAFAYAVKKESCPVDDDTYETLYRLCEDNLTFQSEREPRHKKLRV